MAHDVFISYSRKNKNTADAVCNALESSGIRCWIAPRDILPGKEWGEAIVNAISESKAMVLIFSAASNESQQVLREVERAVNKNVIIIPFRIEDVVPTKSMEYFLYSTHWLDALTPDMSKHIDQLCSTVVNLIGTEKPTVSDDPKGIPAKTVTSGTEGQTDNKTGRREEKQQLQVSKPLIFAACAIMLLAVAFGVYGLWFAPGRGQGSDDFTFKVQQGQNAAGQDTVSGNTGSGNTVKDDTYDSSEMGPQITADGGQLSEMTDTGNIEPDDLQNDPNAAGQTDSISDGGDGAATQASNNKDDQIQAGKTETRGSSASADVSADSKPDPAVQTTQLKIGDYISFGKYYGQPVIWRVINVDDEGYPLLLSEKLLGFKSFDAAEREKSSNEARKTYGSNFWENSNIREWLNSSDKKVNYSTTAPVMDNVSYGDNSYADEPGFLAGFTAEELKLIKEHPHRILLPELEKDQKEFGTELFSSIRRDRLNVIYGNYDISFGKTVKDKVFLLSIKELKDYVLDRGWDVRAVPTPQAAARDESDYEELKHETDGNWSWWLSTPCATTPECVYFVSYDGSLDQTYAFLSNICVRPAMYLSGSKLVLTGSGTEDDPYVH